MEGSIISVLLLLQSIECILTYSYTDYLYIGIIANGPTSVEIKNLTTFDYNISLHWHSIDTSEMYNIYRIVKELDGKSEIDAIILFDYDSNILHVPLLARSTNKTLIQWGQGALQNSKNKFEDQEIFKFDSTCICGFDSTKDTHTHCSQYDDFISDLGNNGILTLHGSKTIVELVRILNWKLVFIFYETATEKEMSNLVDKLSEEEVLISLFNINKIPDLRAVFQKMYDNSIQRNREIKSIVMCRYNCVREILTTANTFDVDNQGYKTHLRAFSNWLVVVYGQCYEVARCLKKYANELDNIVVVGFPEIYTNGSKKFPKLLESVLLDIKKEEVQEHAINFKKLVIERIMAAGYSPTASCLAFSIDTLMYTTSGRQFNSVGRFSINGTVSVHSDIFPNTKFGYNNRHFNISTLQSKPFVYKHETNGSKVFVGFCFDMLNALSKKLNFTYSVVEPPDGLWGSAPDDTNLTFNGLIGQLQRGEVDMVVGPITTTYERLQAIDFSSPFYYDYASVLVKKPDVNARKWRTLIDPFKWEVLVAIGISCPLVTVLAFVLEKYNPFYKKMKHAEDRASTGGIHTLQNSIWYMYGALLCQGGVHLPYSVAGRTLVSAWWLFCIVIVGIYSGNLIAFLTVTKEKPPFTTLDEMTKQKSTYKWGTLKGTSHEMTFLHSNNPTYKAIGDGLREFNRSDPDVLHKNVKVHIRKVKQGKYAWIADHAYIELLTSTDCNLMSIKQRFLSLKYALGFTKHSPHTAIFSEQVMKLFEGGLFQIWERKWWPKDNFCKGDILTEAKPISLLDVQSAFYVCCVGIFLGLLAVLFELILHKCKTRRVPEGKINSCNNTVHMENITED